MKKIKLVLLTLIALAGVICAVVSVVMMVVAIQFMEYGRVVFYLSASWFGAYIAGIAIYQFMKMKKTKTKLDKQDFVC